MEEEIKCFICKKPVTDKEISEGLFEMVEAPGFNTVHIPKTGPIQYGPNFNKKVFVCKSHDGVAKIVEEENKRERNN